MDIPAIGERRPDKSVGVGGCLTSKRRSRAVPNLDGRISGAHKLRARPFVYCILNGDMELCSQLGPFRRRLHIDTVMRRRLLMDAAVLKKQNRLIPVNDRTIPI